MFEQSFSLSAQWLSNVLHRHAGASSSPGPVSMKRPAAAAKRPAAAAIAAAKKPRPLSTTMRAIENILSAVPPKDLKTLKNNLNKMAVLPVGGGCSGSNVAGVVTDILMEALSVRCKQVELYVCEQDSIP
jgi:hypothetical protein